MTKTKIKMDEKLKKVLRRICELQPHWSKENTPEMQERGTLINKELTRELKTRERSLASKMGLYGSDFGVGSSDGMGSKTEAPWARFHSERMSPRASDGYYAVIHFKRDGSGLYLTLGCGSTSWVKGSLVTLKEELLKQKTEIARKIVVSEHGDLGSFIDQITLGVKNKLPKAFEQATVLSKFIGYEDINETNFEPLLEQLAIYLKSVYEGQSVGFDLTQADQQLIEIERTIKSRKIVRGSQGFGLTAKEKKAVEICAMKVTEKWLKAHGYRTEDTSATKPYDLLATKDEQEIFVEVKGTTSTDPNAVLMTANEVNLHRENKGSSALAIVSSIKLHKGDEPRATEGLLDIQIGWDIDQWELTPTAYRVERT